ncbi:efflux RND transporter periplasmic adaptor subunit [Arthrobacter zhaoguopingii]|uniref:efflux RND transporter periplasmic adaptor subunit n=1 Tax=Arthrobacter zhaoguopingii TaxID=2681491 RepID=UPI00135B0B17|nr:efflux RND transporter periplasmic adaptor subunit [Arthrobacter zhaoguopingii]
MAVLRRAVFPAAWLLVFLIIAAALVKMAFFSAAEPPPSSGLPAAEVLTPTVPVTRGTVANTVELTGTVAADEGVSIRSTAAGEVVYLFVEEGQEVSLGDPLFQVRTPAEVQPQAPAGTEGEDEDSGVPVPAPEPVYEYFDITAPASGTLTSFPPLIGESVSIGQSLGSVSPGTYHVTGTLTAAQQFRLLDRPSSAAITIAGGSAPFTCKDPRIGDPKPEAGGTPPASERTAMAGPMGGEGPPAAGDDGSAPAGELTCGIPSEVPSFAGLSASIKLSAGVAENVMTVPTTAVQGSIAEGIVWVLGAEGAQEERKVGLGLNDGSTVEILSGLTEGENVLEFVPGVDVPLQPGMQPAEMGGRG